MCAGEEVCVGEEVCAVSCTCGDLLSFEALTLYKCDRKNSDLFVLSWGRVWHHSLVSAASDMLTEGDVACISLLILLAWLCVVNAVVCIRFMFV